MDKFSVLEKKIKEEDFIVQLGKILNEEEKKIDNFNDLSTKVTISSSENNNMKNNLIPNCNSTSIENINSISNIIKNILILADKSLLEVLLNDENYLTVFGALEYDFETYKIVPHRKYFTEIVKFKNLLDIKNKEILPPRVTPDLRKAGRTGGVPHAGKQVILCANCELSLL